MSAEYMEYKRLWPTIEDVQKEIQSVEVNIEKQREDLRRVRPIYERFEDIADELLLPEEFSEREHARKDYDEINRALGYFVGKLEVMRRHLKQRQEEEETGKRSVPQKAMSVVSQSSEQKRKQLDLTVKGDLIRLRQDYETAKQDLEDAFEESILDIKSETLSAEDMQRILEAQKKIELKMNQLQRRYKEDRRRIIELKKHEEAALQLQEDDEQQLGSDDEQQVRNFDDKTSKHHRAPTPSESSEDDFHSLDQYMEAAGATVIPKRRKVPVVDKDQLMVQVLQKQMELLETSKGEKFLPDFTGDPAQWGNFKSAYDRLKKRVDNGELMTKLQKALKGNAKDTVEHLMANINNVPKIVEILERRYGRPEFVLDYLVEKAKTCNRPDLNKPESIVEFGIAVEALVSTINSYHEEDYLNNKHLVTELTEKLPGAMKFRWFDWMRQGSRKMNLFYFHRWLQNEVDVALFQIKPTVEKKVLADKRKATEKSEERKSRRVQGTMNAAAGDEEKQSENEAACFLCQKKAHPLEKCWVFQKKNNDDRWKVVKENRHCFKCLRKGHITAECRKKTNCGEGGCNRAHHPLLHVQKKFDRPREPNHDEPPAAPNEDEEAVGVGAAVFLEGTDGPLAIVPVKIMNSETRKCEYVYALLDTGATRTLIDTEAADRLQLKGPRLTYRYKNMGGKIITNYNAMKVNLGISGRYKNAAFNQLTDVITVNDIGIPPYSINIDEVKRKWPHLKKMRGDNLKEVVPEIVIGGDHAFLMAHRELLMTKLSEPIAMRTVLGWVIQGKFNSNSNGIGTRYYVGGISTDDQLSALVKDSFKLDDYGIKSDKSGFSVEDKRAYDVMTKTAVKKDGRWTIGLPWKNEEEELPTNESRNAAMARLQSMERRMRKDPEFAAVYKKKIAEYFEKGFIRKLSPEEAAMTSKKTFYISHFGVTNPNKPGKFRLVFDAAEKVKGESLNEKLMTGPDLVCNLVKVLWNFRLHRVALTGDIEDMFHRVFIQEKDRTSQRFLWRDGETTRGPDTYEMKVMIFGATSSPSCATFIKNLNASQFAEEYPDAARATQEKMYCDDLLCGGETATEVVQLRKDISYVNEAGGFVLKKYLSNSPEVMDSIPMHLKLEQKSQEISDVSYERVLGMWWNPVEDTFCFKINFHKVSDEVLNGRRPTKREMCSLLMSLYDPVGFLGHFKIKGMILLQRVWKSGTEWDEDIPEEIYLDWRKWLEELPDVELVNIPRCYNENLKNCNDVQLHTFVDSSEDAYAAVSYLRMEAAGEVKVAFVSSKVRVAPLRKTTIPRLELQAAVLGVKLADRIQEDLDLKINKRYFWTDSSTVLAWIKSSTGRFKEYVANRVGFIQENSELENWKWIPTKENVADDATRAGGKTEFSSSSRWLNGPKFLLEKAESWPSKDVPVNDGVVAVHLDQETETGSESEDFSIPDVSKFSKLYRFVRATAAVSAAFKFWMDKTKKKTNETPWRKTDDGLVSLLGPDDIAVAKVRILRVAQNSFDAAALKKMKNLSLVKDEATKLLRVKRRVPAGKDGYPILLPAKHPITDLIVDAEHVRNAHTGKDTVYNALRQRYWITGGRNAVRRCFARCNYCRMKRAKPIIPEMGNLPSYRLAAYNPPFTFCGVDFFGPMEVTVGRRHEKRWGALFTCMVTRAVYLDLTTGLSADEMMMLLSRFFDTYGIPKNMYSDNATNFKAVQKILSKEKLCSMKWTFIPPASPHFGGAWERMVGAVKKVLLNVMHGKFPKEEVLRTALKAAERIVNSRPLSYVSTDLDDEAALTPMDFIRGQVCLGTSSFLGDGVDSSAESMRSAHLKSQHYANQIWKRWTQEVLPDLIRRTKWYDQKEAVRVGDLVLLVDDQQPRNTWMKGIVTNVHPGKDGLVRVVDVTTKLRESRTHTVYRRSVAKIVPLGIRMEDSVAVPGDAPKPGAGNVGTILD